MVVGIQLEHMQVGVIAVLVAPLLSALVNVIWGRHLGNKAHIPALVGMTVAWAASIVLLIGSLLPNILQRPLPRLRDARPVPVNGSLPLL